MEGEGTGEGPKILATGLEGEDQVVSSFLGSEHLGRAQGTASHPYIGALWPVGKG